MLVSSFNEMLGQIQDRDQKLAHHKETLEEEVEARTAQLVSVNMALRTESERAQSPASLHPSPGLATGESGSLAARRSW